MRSILVGAHRGAMCYAPENTLAAFERAIAFGTYRIECDVRRSRDGHIVLMHGATVDRTTDGGGRVADLTLAELTRLKVGGTEPIPTLAEALALSRGRCKLLVEILVWSVSHTSAGKGGGTMSRRCTPRKRFVVTHEHHDYRSKRWLTTLSNSPPSSASTLRAGSPMCCSW